MDCNNNCWPSGHWTVKEQLLGVRPPESLLGLGVCVSASSAAGRASLALRKPELRGAATAGNLRHPFMMVQPQGDVERLT